MLSVEDRKSSDPLMVVLMLALMVVSAVIISSVTIFIAERSYHNPFYFFNRHIAHIALSALSFFIAYRVRPELWVRYRVAFLGVAFLLLLLVLIPGIGTNINGARRWIRFPMITLQTSDPAKLLFILFTSAYAANKTGSHLTFVEKWLPILVLLCAFDVLLLLQPDFGTSIVISGVIFQILFIAGMPILSFIMILSMAAIQATLLAVLTPYRFARIVSFLNPWLFPFSSGYQLTQSLMAIGRGGIWGVGLGSSLQKIFYLPEAHTDFIFAIICEELGAVGGLTVLLVFLLIVLRLISWSYYFYQQQQFFYSYYFSGLSCWLALQAVVSSGVNMGLLPTKGISMPFLSYGGTHLLTTLFAFGIAFRMISERHKGGLTL